MERRLVCHQKMGDVGRYQGDALVPQLGAAVIPGLARIVGQTVTHYMRGSANEAQRALNEQIMEWSTKRATKKQRTSASTRIERDGAKPKKEKVLTRYLAKRSVPTGGPQQMYTKSGGLPSQKTIQSRIYFNEQGNAANVFGAASTELFKVNCASSIPISDFAGTTLTGAAHEYPAANFWDKLYQQAVIEEVKVDLKIRYRDTIAVGVLNVARLAAWTQTWNPLMEDESGTLMPKLNTKEAQWEAMRTVYQMMSQQSNPINNEYKRRDLMMIESASTLATASTPDGSIHIRRTIRPDKFVASLSQLRDNSHMDVNTVGYQMVFNTASAAGGATSAPGPPFMYFYVDTWPYFKTEENEDSANGEAFFLEGTITSRIRYYNPITVDQSNPLA